MKNKLIIFLLLTIIIFSSILIHKINQTPTYNEKIYKEVYTEYLSIKNSTNDNVNTTIKFSSHPKDKPIYTYKNSTGSTYRTTGVIEIPKINLSYPIITDYSEANLNIAPTKFVGPQINSVGNFVIVGHNNRNKEFFSNLNKLQNDDIITLTDHNNNSQNYKVYNIYEIKQTDFSCLNQNTNGKIELTLITCIKYKKNKRLVIKCIAI